MMKDDDYKNLLNPYFYAESLIDFLGDMLSTKTDSKTNEIKYESFYIKKFKAIESAKISLERSDLVLLLGLNEHGKTSILKSIEAFDYRNDPDEHNLQEKFLRSIRNKHDIYSNQTAQVIAKIHVDKLDINELKIPRKYEDKKDALNSIVQSVNDRKHIEISRNFTFNEGKPSSVYYTLCDGFEGVDDKHIVDAFCRALITKCPLIVYFEDFKDRVPEKIPIHDTSELYDSDWRDIIDGLFYATDKNFSLEKFDKLYLKGSPTGDDSTTILNRVNLTLNNVFTRKWTSLTGVKDISRVTLSFHPAHIKAQRYFELKIEDQSGTTFSVSERSKGAIWYLSFLMKTEFRKKKLRSSPGRPIFLIDEPASNLHSTAQTKMLDDFNSLVEDTSVIYSTHSRYLVSLENIRNTYVVRKVTDSIKLTKWGEYIQSSDTSASYYQPIQDLLNIVPNSLDIPWKNAIIVEGPSDRHVILTIFRSLYPEKVDNIAIYPGGSATKLETLISLNLGWATNFLVILDNDQQGQKSYDKYKDKFKLKDREIKKLPSRNIERMFTSSDLCKLWDEYIFDVDNPIKLTKKHIAYLFAKLSQSDKSILCILSKSTISKFKSVFDHYIQSI